MTSKLETDRRQEPDSVPPESQSDGVRAASNSTVPVVAIGASAGGLEVFKRLLADLPVDTGFAIVFVQHLEPNHQSMLAGILGRATAMPVNEAADGMQVEANHLYVIPANAELTLTSGHLKVAPRTQSPGSHMPIDCFFRSVAKQCRSHAIGVIFSGTGSDGSAGIEAIKAAGGVTFAQDAASAKFATMPEAAVATGCIDFVLTPEAIAAELVRIGQHPYMATVTPEQTEETSASDEAHFSSILTALQHASGIDFSLYREKMIKRRILRRLALRSIRSLDAYSKLLETDAGELAALQQDLLIGVTSFFRDPEAFACLKTTVFPRVVKNRPRGDTIRVWVAGCATGEEAYSVAISLEEFLNENGLTFPVQIFASDISVSAIERARIGRYPENIAVDLSPERLNRFFTKLDNGYQINKNLREMCVFTRHNLIGDPPFSKLDLITCRNVLIYLGSVQKTIIPLFHYAIKQGGFLMLGASEGAADNELFAAVDSECRVYSKRESARRAFLFPAGTKGSRPPAHTAAQVWGTADLRKEIDRVLLAKYCPSGVVVDADLEVLEIVGKASPYLALPIGKASFNLMKLVPDTSLFLEVEKLIQQAQRTSEIARQERFLWEHEGNVGSLNLEAIPLDSGQNRSMLVLFEPVSLPPGEEDKLPGLPPGDVRNQQIVHLKQQLVEAKERFLSAIEAHQTTREENQNTTEEALSANEELQSLNEELETAKEELQSTNEELLTLNDELQVKNTALDHARDFAMSIVETVRQPLLVLDNNFRIKMANQAFCRAFQVSSLEAVGQVIYALSRGSWNLPALREALDALHRGNSFLDFEARQDFPVVGTRDLVLSGRRIEHLQMILLAIDDITERKLAQQALRRSEDHVRQAQKMEAVGRLAGGIAHDFNNLLTGIIGYSSLLTETLADDPAALEEVKEIRNAADRAASLTQQLLAFSRRQVLQPTVLDLNAIVTDFDRMLRRLVGERIKVILELEPALWPVRVDAGEVGRAIMNLTLNARDAMPDGGTLSIVTTNTTVSDTNAPSPELAPGRYVTVAVRDTGVGISAEARALIFEPFFTTKDVNKGTGLGLATVLGIVDQSGGVILCDSQIAEGTVFTIYLRAVEAAVQGVHPAGAVVQPATGSEVILLVEDEDMVRGLARRVLERGGYQVHDACDGQEALAFLETHEGPIDLLLSDVVMPGISGRELTETALKFRPTLKVIFMSGHTQDAILKEGIQRGTPFLQKPFMPAALLQKVREALDVEKNP